MSGYEKMLVLLVGGLFLAAISTVRAEENVPALLRYAQEYDARKDTPDRVGHDALASPASPSRQALQALQRRQLMARVKALTAQLADKNKVLTALQNGQSTSVERDAKLNALTAQLAAVTTREQALTVTLAEKERQLAEQVKRVLPPVALDTAAARQAYATGVLFGRNIQEARQANRLIGLTLDEAPLLAGVTDALTGQTKMDDRALAASQAAARRSAETALVGTVAAQKKADAAWMARFTKDKGVVSSPDGYWYKVIYAGDGARLSGEDTVELVVTETLTDGTVVSDMESAGSQLTEKVSALPPAFAGALAALKNHGSLTLVVPPALAYGDKGYPPKVPPGAMMVYRLRVADVVGIVPPPKKGKS